MTKSNDGHVHVRDFFFRAMKWLRLSGREAQQDWYGKRGTSWHVAHAMWKADHRASSLQARAYVHLFDQSQQSGSDVHAILTHLLQEIKEELPDVDTVYIRSDNGPHYHQSTVMASIHSISKQTGIFIQRWTFSEAQAGKGPCDRISAVVKNHLYRYVAEKHHVRNAEEFLVGVRSGNGLAGVSFYHGIVTEPSTETTEEESPLKKKTKGTVPPTSRKTKWKAEIPGISMFHDWLFRFDNQGKEIIHAWKHYAIGPGVEIEQKYWLNKQYRSTFQVLGTAHPTRGLWNLHSDVSTLDEPDNVPADDDDEDILQDYGVRADGEGAPSCPEPMDTDSFQEDIAPNQEELTKTSFECPHENCVKSFLRFGNLMKHLERGDHKYLLTRENTMDHA